MNFGKTKRKAVVQAELAAMFAKIIECQSRIAAFERSRPEAQAQKIATRIGAEIKQLLNEDDIRNDEVEGQSDGRLNEADLR